MHDTKEDSVIEFVGKTLHDLHDNRLIFNSAGNDV